MKEVKGFIFTAVISAFIGGLVALPFILIYKNNIIINFIESCIVGLVIGVVSRFVFMFFYLNVRKKTFLAFCLVFIIIGLGTFTGAFILGESNILHIFMMIFLAEIIGLTASCFIFHYTIKLNEKLKNIKEKIKKSEFQ